MKNKLITFGDPFDEVNVADRTFLSIRFYKWSLERVWWDELWIFLYKIQNSEMPKGCTFYVELKLDIKSKRYLPLKLFEFE